MKMGLDVTASISLILLAKMSVNPFSTQMLYGGALPIKKLKEIQMWQVTFSSGEIRVVFSCLQILNHGVVQTIGILFPCVHFPTQGRVQIIGVFPCIKGNKDLIFLLFGKHPANQMISVRSWPILREIYKDLISLPFPETARRAHIMWVLSAYMKGNKDLISLLSFSAASNIDLHQGKQESYVPVFISWTMEPFKQYVFFLPYIRRHLISLRPFPTQGLFAPISRHRD